MCADDTPTVVRVARTLVIATNGLVVIIVVVNETRRLWGHSVEHTASHRAGVGETLFGEVLTIPVAPLLIIESIVVVIAADAGHIIHRRGHGSLDACVGSGGIQGDTTPTADAYDAYLLGIDIVLFRQEVDGCHKVLGIDVG